MNKSRRLLGLLAGLSILCLLVPMAQAGEYNLGGGIGIAPDYVGSDNYELVPLPAGEAYFDNGMYIELLGLNLRANLMLERWVSWLKLGPVYNYRPSRSDVDNSQVDDLENVSDANELGGFVKLVYKRWHVNLEYLADIGDAHDGEYAELSLGYTWPFSDTWTFSFGAFGTWADDDYHEAYFEVSPEDSIRSGLEPYDADSGIKDIGLNLGANWRFASNWNLRGLFQIKQLVGDADDDSPVVDEGDETQIFTGLLIMYSF